MTLNHRIIPGLNNGFSLLFPWTLFLIQRLWGSDSIYFENFLTLLSANKLFSKSNLPLWPLCGYFIFPILFFFSSFTLRAVPWFIELKSDGHWVSCVNQALGLGSCCDIKIASPPRIPNDSHYFSRESEHCYLIYSYWIPDDSHHFEVSLRVDISHWGSMAVAIRRTQKLCF